MEENKRERWKKAVLPEGDTKMGFYLNSRAPYVLYEGETKSRYFIDKTLMLEKIFGFIEEEVDGLYEKYLADTVNPNGKLLDKFWSIWWDLKVDDTAESAVRQIKEKGYALRFQGKLGDDKVYTGDILAIGIGYWKDTKEHECKIEKLSI